MNRRELILTGGACLIAAPAIVRAEWLMPVKAIEPTLIPLIPDLDRLQWVRFEPWYTEDMDETLIRLIRDNVPKMIARDICGVQPMGDCPVKGYCGQIGPTGKYWIGEV